MLTAEGAGGLAAHLLAREATALELDAEAAALGPISVAGLDKAAARDERDQVVRRGEGLLRAIATVSGLGFGVGHVALEAGGVGVCVNLIATSTRLLKRLLLLVLHVYDRTHRINGDPAPNMHKIARTGARAEGMLPAPERRTDRMGRGYGPLVDSPRAGPVQIAAETVKCEPSP